MRSSTIIICLLAAGCSNSHEGRRGDGRDPDPVADTGMPADDGGTPIVTEDDGGEATEDAAVAVALDGGPTEPDAGPIVTPDAGPRPDTSGIACGMRTCDVATQGCLASCLYATDERMPACVAVDGEGRWPADECPTGREMFPRYWLQCDGAEDCAPGEACNMVYGSLGQYAYCGPLDASQRLCHRDADCPATAPRCRPNADLPDYSTCVAP